MKKKENCEHKKTDFLEIVKLGKFEQDEDIGYTKSSEILYSIEQCIHCEKIIKKEILTIE